MNMRESNWRLPALLEVWVNPEQSEMIVWKTRRRGFKYEIAFEQVPMYNITVNDTPYGRGFNDIFPIPTLECRKRKELNAIAAHYVETLTNAGYRRVYSFNR